MKKLLVASFLFVASTTGAFASSAMSDEVSTDLSGAVGQSAGTGAAIVGISAAVPLMSAGASGEAVLESSFDTLGNWKPNGKPLPVTDETIIRRPAPDRAMKSKQ
ncbi:MAG: hypothetical protein ABJL17_05190 [Parvibaculum sp.]|uniref:hypothetical protein n=1 Tax=Parvibaculum sp. TaxID=2024848 RepID=UPI0032646285